MRPLWRAATEAVLTSTVMHIDATGLAVLAHKEPGGKRLGSLWGYIGDTTTAAMLYTSTGKKLGQRDGEVGPAQMLERRRGYVVADAAGISATTRWPTTTRPARCWVWPTRLCMRGDACPSKSRPLPNGTIPTARAGFGRRAGRRWDRCPKDACG